MEAHLTPKPFVQVNKIAYLCEICSGPHDTQYCMENPEQAFVDYPSLRTDEAGGKWFTFKPEKDNLGDTYNPSWKSHPNLRTPKPKEPEKTLEDEFKNLHLNLPVLEVLANAPIYNAILDKYVESLELGKNGSTFIQGEMPKKMKDLGLFTLPCRLGDSDPFDTLVDLGSCVNFIPLYLFKKLKIGLLEETDHVFGLADGTKSYPVGIVKNVEVHIGKFKLLEDFYVIDMEKDPTARLLVGRGFLATFSAVIDCKKAKIAVGEGITRCLTPLLCKKDFMNHHFPGEWEIARDAELNPFKDILAFRKTVEFLGAIPINLKGNMWESEELIEKIID
ncbi:MAK10-like protein [Tanacetum coccineum]